MSATRISSMQRFKALTKELRVEVRRESIVELNAGADLLVQQMRAVAPKDKGNLVASIRKLPGPVETRVKVVAGGALTTREVRVGSGVGYDYSRAVEFGTTDERPQPFFWPSWRLRRKTIRSRLKRKITQNIKAKSA